MILYLTPFRMYTFLKYIISQKLVIEQLPIFLVSMFIAESAYKFHSFTLECIAFLSTWFVLDILVTTIGRRFRK